MNRLLSLVRGKCRRALAERFSRRMAVIKTSVPIISFTFDDAPRTAFTTGSEILRSHGARATYFISLGLLDSETEVGTIGSADNLLQAAKEGHELGCHTFDHLNTWETTTEKYFESVLKNREALKRILPGSNFRTFAYPISEPRPSIKFQLEKVFICCRGGGQTLNAGKTDLNLLKGYFLDKRNNIDLNSVKRLIDYNTSCRGWLIFATHDVNDNPSQYGCTMNFFSDVVKYAAHSGASLLPVREACEKLMAPNTERIGLK